MNIYDKFFYTIFNASRHFEKKIFYRTDVDKAFTSVIFMSFIELINITSIWRDHFDRPTVLFIYGFIFAINYLIFHNQKRYVAIVKWGDDKFQKGFHIPSVLYVIGSLLVWSYFQIKFY